MCKFLYSKVSVVMSECVCVCVCMCESVCERQCVCVCLSEGSPLYEWMMLSVCKYLGLFHLIPLCEMSPSFIGV